VNRSNPVIIKKYGNRRLYNTAESRYINLDEVAQIVRDGVNLQVVDANSGEDLTRLVLTQIIVENAKEPESAFPLDLLRQMVVAQGKLTQESVLNYTQTMMDMYRNAYRAFSPPLTPFDVFQSMMTSAAPGGKPAAPPQAAKPAQEPDPNAAQAEVKELRRRIEELERTVAQSENNSPPAKKQKRSKR
jgi:polyhydroxyalkanoate synthesis repressor PhaR